MSISSGRRVSISTHSKNGDKPEIDFADHLLLLVLREVFVEFRLFGSKADVGILVVADLDVVDFLEIFLDRMSRRSVVGDLSHSGDCRSSRRCRRQDFGVGSKRYRQDSDANWQAWHHGTSTRYIATWDLTT
jgi:hypothetical protein